MKTTLLLLSFFFLTNNFASGGGESSLQSSCSYVEGSAKVQWTGFKTKKKVPVKGFLKKVKITSTKGKTPQEIMAGSTFEVSGKKGSVDSKNVARDTKIAKFFFGNFKGGPVIKGQVTDVTKNKITTRMTFNGRTQTVSLRYKLAGGMLTARGGFDFVSLFGAKKSHDAIGKACAAKHEGATGTEAFFQLTAKFTGC